MLHGHERVSVGHPGAGKPHDFSDPLAHPGFITVNHAVGAGRFVVLMGATDEPFGCIVEKFIAVLTKGFL